MASLASPTRLRKGLGLQIAGHKLRVALFLLPATCNLQLHVRPATPETRQTGKPLRSTSPRALWRPQSRYRSPARCFATPQSRCWPWWTRSRPDRPLRPRISQAAGHQSCSSRVHRSLSGPTPPGSDRTAPAVRWQGLFPLRDYVAHRGCHQDRPNLGCYRCRRALALAWER